MASIKFTDEKTSEKMLILLADDDEDDRSFFTQAFEKVRNMDTELQVFENGVQLLDSLKTVAILPHIVFLDLNMPLKSGTDCLREIRADHRFDGISVAIYSTSDHTRDVEETFGLGANIYINKPNSFEQLKKVLKHVLKINWQFHLAGMNKETFFLSV